MKQKIIIFWVTVLMMLALHLIPQSSLAATTVNNKLSTDLLAMRNNYEQWSGNLPLGDINRKNIGSINTTNEHLIFSESVSYALFSHVLPIAGENERQAKTKFLTYWKWAKKNLVRKNIKQVFSLDGDTPTWIGLPQELNDNLMAWRWVPKIDGTDKGGIIYQTDPKKSPVFQDGSQVASDGDLLTAYALILAYERGWGNNLLLDAKAIIGDLRKKAIVDFKAGELINAMKQPHPLNKYFGFLTDIGTITIDQEPNVIAWRGKNNYVGFWHNPRLDLTHNVNGNKEVNLEKIEIKLRGNIGNNAMLTFRIEDSIDGQKPPGHIYSSESIPLQETFNTVILTPEQLTKFIYYGVQEGNLDWSKISNLQLQVDNADSQQTESYVALESINLVLKEGQTQEHNGYHLTSNAHGLPSINVSYFMPFAYRTFAKYDTIDGAAVWSALLDNSYADMANSLNISLHDQGQLVTDNGYLFPNWFQLDRLTGDLTDISFDDKDVKGSYFGYDAFRTLWYLAYDHYLYGDIDSRSLNLLEKIYPFFASEMNDKNHIYSEYSIDGTPKDVDAYKYTPFGFYTVYLDLFHLNGDGKNVSRILDMYQNQRRSVADGSRVWVASADKEMKHGKEEYYMNFWTFFGGYLYAHFVH